MWLSGGRFGGRFLRFGPEVGDFLERCDLIVEILLHEIGVEDGFGQALDVAQVADGTRRGQTTSGVSGHISSVRRSRTTFYKMWSGNVQFLFRCRMESKDDAGIVRIGLIGTYNSGS